MAVNHSLTKRKIWSVQEEKCCYNNLTFDEKVTNKMIAIHVCFISYCNWKALLKITKFLKIKKPGRCYFLITTPTLHIHMTLHTFLIIFFSKNSPCSLRVKWHLIKRITLQIQAHWMRMLITLISTTTTIYKFDYFLIYFSFRFCFFKFNL